jgi:hypothetical protein
LPLLHGHTGMSVLLEIRYIIVLQRLRPLRNSGEATAWPMSPAPAPAGPEQNEHRRPHKHNQMHQNYAEPARV